MMGLTFSHLRLSMTIRSAKAKTKRRNAAAMLRKLRIPSGNKLSPKELGDAKIPALEIDSLKAEIFPHALLSCKVELRRSTKET